MLQALIGQMQLRCFGARLPGPLLLHGGVLRRYATGGVSRSRVAASLEAGEKFMQSQGLSEADIQHIEEKNPGALKSNVEKVLEPKVAFLQQHAFLKGSELASVLRAQPRVLSSSLEGHLKPTVDYISGVIGVRTPRALAKLFTARPVLLTYQVEDMLAPKVQFLLDLGVDKESLPAIVSRSPDILSTGVGNDLQPTVAYLKTLLPDKLIAAKIMKNPVLFHYPLAILRKNVKFLQDKGCGAEVLQKIVAESNTVFRVDIEASSTLAKWQYAEDKLGGALAVLADCPHFLDHSLSLVIKPRIAFMKETSPASAANMASYLKLPAKEWEKACPGYTAWRAASKGRKSKSK